ncbi:hypothetical protein RJJ37_29960, partial [Rhizobium redzepovicii]
MLPDEGSPGSSSSPIKDNFPVIRKCERKAFEAFEARRDLSDSLLALSVFARPALERLFQFRQGFEQIGDEAVVGDLEDR